MKMKNRRSLLFPLIGYTSVARKFTKTVKNRIQKFLGDILSVLEALKLKVFELYEFQTLPFNK